MHAQIGPSKARGSLLGQRFARALVACLGALSLNGVVVAQPVVVEQLTISTPGGTCRAYLATVDLLDPRVSIKVTGALPAAPVPPVGADSQLQTVPAWRSATGAKVAINANFFATLSGGYSDLVGLSVSDGVVVSPARQFGSGLPDPAIVFNADRTARIDYIAPGNTSGVQNAVAGVGPSNTDTDAGTLLITDGTNTGGGARVDPNNRNPRTVVGVNRDGTRLYLFVVDGRQTGWSVGMTNPEVADYLIKRNVWRAINLDGGGSSSFVAALDNGTTLQNRPSDSGNVFRPVANHLGIMVNGNLSGSGERARRIVRGAWLRPPTTLSTLESTVQTLAQNGIRDLFLETLYWGQDTAQTGVFPARSFPSVPGDYLKQAIEVCNKYGVRTHAWCETGYLDFGTTPSALLQANPDWVVKNIDPAASPPTGDLANQRFVNLGNPGVRSILNSYFGTLATRYHGLEGIQADYHFFPLEASNTAPWSYDNWARSAYQAQFGVDPATFANVSGSTYHSNWVSWNRGNVTTALVQLRDAVRNVSPTSIAFSCVSFADWSSSIHLSKMIDLPSWGSTNAADLYMFMAYFATTTSIATDCDRAIAAVPGKRLVVGLANLTTGTRPTVTDQLNTIKNKGLEDFAWFEANTFIANSGMLTMLSDWITNVGAKQIGDINLDEWVDVRDRALFDALYTGTPITRNAGNARYDLNNDNVIDGKDSVELDRLIKRWRFGEDGVVDFRDLWALRAAFTQGTGSVPAILNRWDLNGDGKVDSLDEDILRANATVDLTFAYDVNNDGVVNIEDLVSFSRVPTDVNKDGSINVADQEALREFLRQQEPQKMQNGNQGP